MYKRQAPRREREPMVRDPLDGMWWFVVFVLLTLSLLFVVPWLAALP